MKNLNQNDCITLLNCIAFQVNSWDRMIFENGEAIVNLNEDVEKVKADQTVSIYDYATLVISL